MKEDDKLTVRKLTLGPDDVLVVTVPGAISMATHGRLQAEIKSAFPEYKKKVLVLSNGLGLTVVSLQQQKEEATAHYVDSTLSEEDLGRIRETFRREYTR